MELIIKSQPIATACRAAYVRSDYAVMYFHEPAETYEVRTLADLIDEQFGIRRDWPVEVLADTLAVSFDGPTKELAFLSAYTN